MDIVEARKRIEDLEEIVRKLRRDNVEMVAARLRAEGLLRYFRSQAGVLKEDNKRESEAAKAGRKLLLDLRVIVAQASLTLHACHDEVIGREGLCHKLRKTSSHRTLASAG